MDHGERFNGYTHMAGAVLALAGASVLMVFAALRADAWRIVSFSVYGSTLILLYLASTFYHGARGRAKAVFRRLDHCSIYLLIAGTYTPFALVTLHGAWGRSLFGAVWALAVVGIAQEYWLARGSRMTSLAIYVLMGWLLYTGGIVFYLFGERVRHFHGIWHLFVMGGSAAHYVAIATFVA